MRSHWRGVDRAEKSHIQGRRLQICFKDVTRMLHGGRTAGTRAATKHFWTVQVRAATRLVARLRVLGAGMETGGQDQCALGVDWAETVRSSGQNWLNWQAGGRHGPVARPKAGSRRVEFHCPHFPVGGPAVTEASQCPQVQEVTAHQGLHTRDHGCVTHVMTAVSSTDPAKVLLPCDRQGPEVSAPGLFFFPIFPLLNNASCGLVCTAQHSPTVWFHNPGSHS